MTSDGPARWPEEGPFPFQRHLGMEITGWAEGWARVSMPLGEHLANRQGIPHGGAHAALLDTAMGYAGCFTGDPGRRVMAMTLSLNVSYLSRPRVGPLVAEARRTGGGRSTFFAEGQVRDAEGELCATASGVFRYRRPG